MNDALTKLKTPKMAKILRQIYSKEHDTRRAFLLFSNSLKSVQVVTVIMLKPLIMSEIYTRNGHDEYLL